MEDLQENRFLNKNLSISVLIPIYNDETTIELVVNKAIKFIKPYCNSFEIIIINDKSPDNSISIIESMIKKNKFIKLINHPKNIGYGGTLKTGIKYAKNDILCMIDGDDEYDVRDFLRMLKFINRYDLIIGFRYKKLYSAKRIFISYVYNKILKILFKTNYRDISTGIRVFKKSILENIQITSNSSFVGAELAIKAMFDGVPVGEVGIQTFPNKFRGGSSIKIINIIKTLDDLLRVRKEIFSDSYQLPSGRLRD